MVAPSPSDAAAPDHARCHAHAFFSLPAPERRAGRERALSDLVGQITDGKIADYYRRDFEARVFEAFKRRPARSGQSRPRSGKWQPQKRAGERFDPLPLEPVTAALKDSLLVRNARKAPLKTGAADGSRPQDDNPGALKVKEIEISRLLLEEPELAARHTEMLAAMLFSDPFLDRLLGELLNVAASGSRLDQKGLENHLIRRGMADIVKRLKTHTATREAAEGTGSDEDADARFLHAAGKLRELSETGPERKRALEHFKREPSEENWGEVLRLREDSSGE